MSDAEIAKAARDYKTAVQTSRGDKFPPTEQDMVDHFKNVEETQNKLFDVIDASEREQSLAKIPGQILKLRETDPRRLPSQEYAEILDKVLTWAWWEVARQRNEKEAGGSQ